MLFFIYLLYLKIIKTGDDAETLRKLEHRMQAEYKDGLPPHLQPSARNTAYVPGSDQSRIFVTSHSEFNSLPDRDVQAILHQRLILVHGNPFDYNYGWDLASFGRLFDVEKETTIQGETRIPILRRMFQNWFSFHKC